MARYTGKVSFEGREGLTIGVLLEGYGPAQCNHEWCPGCGAVERDVTVLAVTLEDEPISLNDLTTEECKAFDAAMGRVEWTMDKE